jgi:glutaredoxin
MSYLLLSTESCHLCEQAETLLASLDILYKKIDIADQEKWQRHYATKIPVLLNTETNQKLCWPFNKIMVLAL